MNYTDRLDLAKKLPLLTSLADTADQAQMQDLSQLARIALAENTGALALYNHIVERWANEDEDIDVILGEAFADIIGHQQQVRQLIEILTLRTTDLQIQHGNHTLQ